MSESAEFLPEIRKFIRHTFYAWEDAIASLRASRNHLFDALVWEGEGGPCADCDCRRFTYELGEHPGICDCRHWDGRHSARGEFRR